MDQAEQLRVLMGKSEVTEAVSTPGQSQRPDQRHLAKWLTRAVDTLARSQDDERVVFLLDFDRAFPNGVDN